MNSFVTRTIVGVGFILLVGAALLLNSYVFMIASAFVLGVMLFEFYRMNLLPSAISASSGAEDKAPKAFTIISIAVNLAIYAAVAVLCIFFSFDASLFKTVAVIGFLALLLGIIKSLAFFKRMDNRGKAGMIYQISVLYILVPNILLLIFTTGMENFQGLIILALFFIIWSSDVGAYLLGSTLGKHGHKMCPSISPNKSWWGFFGGMAFAIVFALGISALHIIDITWLQALCLGISMHVTGVSGDIFESKWKRINEFKDSGKMLPGHGGLMDRFDSSIFALTTAILYLSLI